MKQPHLNRSLALEHPVQTADNAGGFVTEWQMLGILWAALTPASTREAAGQAAPLARAAYKVIVRAAPNGSPRRPRPGQRFRAGIRIFAVETVTEYDTDARYLQCLTKEETAS